MKNAYMFVGTFCVGICIFASSVWSQTTTGTISGVARDDTRAVIPGVEVTVRNVDTGITRVITTNERGRYAVPSLSPGNYEVEASLAGFQTLRRSGIVLTVGSEVIVDLALRVGQLAERIEVTGELPLIETSSSTVSGLMDEKSIRALPLNARSFDQLALFEGAVVSYDFGENTGSRSRGQTMSVAGSRVTQNTYLLDGIEISQHGGGAVGSIIGTNMGVEAIREFQVLTSNFQAEYGRNPGGVINAITRTGTNEFHGSVYEYLRNSVMDAKDFFALPDEPKTPFKRNQFGFTLGGPIQRDQMFFFGNYEGLRARKSLTYNAVVPSLSARAGQLPDGPVTIFAPIRPYLALYPLPNTNEVLANGAASIYYHTPAEKTRQDYVMGRSDVQIAQRHFLFGRYTFEDAGNITPKEDSIFALDFSSRRHQIVVGVDTVLTPTLLNVFRAGFTRNTETEDDGPLVSIPASLSFYPRPDNLGNANMIGRIIVTGYSELGTTQLVPRFYHLDIFEYSNAMNYSRGVHTFKFGANVKRWRDNSSTPTNVRGSWSFLTLRSFLEGNATSHSYQASHGYPYGFRQWSFAFFGQDDYRVTSDLTLNLGVRWEFSLNPTEVNGRIWNYRRLMQDVELEQGLGVLLTKKAVEPRFGFAWSPTASKKTAIRGGFGIYHEHFHPVTYTNYLKAPPPTELPLNVRNVKFQNPFDWTNVTVQPDPPGYRGPELRPKAPSKMSMTLNLEHEILPDTSLMVGYVGSLHRNSQILSTINERIATKDANGVTFYPNNSPFRFPAMGGVGLIRRCCSSHYQGMVVTLRRQPRGPLGFQLSYTWAQSIDYNSVGVGAEGRSSSWELMDPDDYTRDRARSAFNAAHTFAGNYTLDLPSPSEGRILGAILNDWKTQGIVRVSSGIPINIQTGFNRSRSRRSTSSGFDRPDLASGKSNNPVLGDPFLWYDPSAFVLPPPGYFGNLGRNTVIMPGTFNVDFSMVKGFSISERTNLEFKSEFFNLFNTPSFSYPNRDVFQPSGAYLPAAGRILNTRGNNRQVQLSLKLIF